MYITAPIGSMHGIVAYIYLIFSVNVGKYSIHAYMDPIGYTKHMTAVSPSTYVWTIIVTMLQAHVT